MPTGRDAEEPLSHQRPAAIVTGGSRGIGRAIVERLARNGFDIAFSFREREAAAIEVSAAVEGLGGKSVAVRADLAVPEDIAKMFATADKTFGRLDALVLNATTATWGRVTELDAAKFDHAFAVNVRAAFLAFQFAAARMGDGGRIVAISTGVTRNPSAEFSVYAASKAALESLVRSFAREIGARGITVNAVLPGITDTEGLILPASMVGDFVAQTPLGRLGLPADIADVVGFLVSADARWITGERVCVAGGL